MKKVITPILLFVLLGLPVLLAGQSANERLTDSLFANRGEVFFNFRLKNRGDIHRLTSVISIDRVDGNLVTAYANRKEFTDFLDYGAKYTVLPAPGELLSKAELDPVSVSHKGSRTVWNFYPTYDQYVQYMQDFSSSYPELCRLDTVGTSMQGRLILVLKISHNIAQEEAEPQFLYTSSIHGDETTGYVLMMHLADYLLSGYGTNPEVTDLLDNTEICINPLANPDGTYRGGNNNIYGAVRYNMNNIDLNRNFPDPKVGLHPDGNPWQQETVAWMDYAEANHFTMAANFHGGSEVFNYPWDTWSKLNADDSWWQFVGREWADTVHSHSYAGYFTFLNNGVTNGYAWYEVNGGRQDYMNYYHHCREVTLEISNIKLLPVSQLLNFWEYNYRSFLNYIKEARYGFNGIVTDTVTDQPVAAKVFISGYDKDNSEVYSRPTTGFYARPIDEGGYDVTFSAPAYFSKTVHVDVTRRNTTSLNVQLRPLTYDAQDKNQEAILVFPNPTDGNFRLKLPDVPCKSTCSVQVVSMMGTIAGTFDLAGHEESSISLSLGSLPQGMYYLRLNTGYRIYTDKLIIRR